MYSALVYGVKDERGVIITASDLDSLSLEQETVMMMLRSCDDDSSSMFSSMHQCKLTGGAPRALQAYLAPIAYYCIADCLAS